MTPAIKEQAFRVGRLAFLAAMGILLTYGLGLHGAPSVASVEGALILAGETAFRQVFPLIQADLKTDQPALIKDVTTLAAKENIPPAVF